MKAKFKVKVHFYSGLSNFVSEPMLYEKEFSPNESFNSYILEGKPHPTGLVAIGQHVPIENEMITIKEINGKEIVIETNGLDNMGKSGKVIEGEAMTGSFYKKRYSLKSGEKLELNTTFFDDGTAYDLELLDIIE